jgi:hypothetical protein
MAAPSSSIDPARFVHEHPSSAPPVHSAAPASAASWWTPMAKPAQRRE